MTVFAVDFDGTIVKAEYPEIGDLIPGALETMQLMRARGHKIIIWTCRHGTHLEAVKAFLKANEVPYDYLNEHYPVFVQAHGYEPRKIFADYYIDDRNITPWTWKDVERIILSLPVEDPQG